MMHGTKRESLRPDIGLGLVNIADESCRCLIPKANLLVFFSSHVFRLLTYDVLYEQNTFLFHFNQLGVICFLRI